MALTSFRIANIKAVSLAECRSVPRIMVIAGPNGVGKSTMLYELSQRRGTTFAPDTTVLYQPPHRAIRASNVRRRFTFGGPDASFASVLERNEVSGYEGMNFPMPARTPDNVDEAGSTIKHLFAKLENRYQTALAARVARAKQSGQANLDLGEIPDIYQALRTFTEYLLPHLEFDKIDLSDENSVKCLWKRKDARQVLSLDIDQLSSGEKSLVTMFLPMIESDIIERLNTIDPPTNVAAHRDTLVIIDEPEQHIHPDLQARVMSYLRQVANVRKTQFIVSTHSPTILDQAWDDELHVMVAAADDPNQNQLAKVATNFERLEALRQLTGSTFAVTTGRSIICIEGHNSGVTEPSDIRILELIFPRATAYTFVPVGSKSSVVNTVRQLRANLPSNSFKINIFGITDNDRGAALPEGVLAWPVCMIENLLLLPTALFAVAQALNSAAVADQNAMDALLDEVIRGERDAEIRLRVTNALRPATIRPTGADQQEVAQSIADQMAPFVELSQNPGRIQTAIDDATRVVDDALARNQGVTVFHGKRILKAVFGRLFPNGIVPYSEFIHQVSMEVAKDPGLQARIAEVFDALEQSATLPEPPTQPAAVAAV